MNQCVPSRDLDNNPTSLSKLLSRPSRNSRSSTPHEPKLDYEVTELTWENGQLALHGLGPPRVPNWDKPRAGYTLEAVVNQATLPPHKLSSGIAGGWNELVPWISGTASATMTMDALVPSETASPVQKLKSGEFSAHVLGSNGTCVVGCSTGMGSCSGKLAGEFDDRIPAHEWSSNNRSVSGSATFGRDTRYSSELGAHGLTSTSLGSPGITSSGEQYTKSTTPDDHDSVGLSRPQRGADDVEVVKGRGKGSGSNKRKRAAATHNQSERKRRNRINQRMKTLQKLVPNSSKSDKASMLDGVIDYVKQLQAQVQMMNRMNMSQLMLPLALQQHQLQPYMIPNPTAMGMGMGMGLGMGMGFVDLNNLCRNNIAGVPPAIHPSAFVPLPAAWEAPAGDRVLATGSPFPDPISTILACQSQSATLEAYARMEALFQQMHQPS